MDIYVRFRGKSGHNPAESGHTGKLSKSQLFPASEIAVLRRLHGSPLCLGSVWGSV